MFYLGNWVFLGYLGILFSVSKVNIGGEERVRFGRHPSRSKITNHKKKKQLINCLKLQSDDFNSKGKKKVLNRFALDFLFLL